MKICDMVIARISRFRWQPFGNTGS